MAMKAINEIKSAEKAGDEAVENAKEKAGSIVSKSKVDGDLIIENRKKEALDQSNMIIDGAKKQAQQIEKDGLERNRQEIEVLSSIINKRTESIAADVAKLIYS